MRRETKQAWRLLFTQLLLLAMISCSEPTTPATLLYFVEHEPGMEPQRTRLLITAGYIRMDGGEHDEDFLLFDRDRGLSAITDDCDLLRLEAYLYTRAGTAIDHSWSYFLPGSIRLHVVRRVGKHARPDEGGGAGASGH